MHLVDKQIEKYAENLSENEPELLKYISQVTNLDEQLPNMHAGHLQGRLLSWLCELSNANHILEIGTFTGYSALCMAENLPTEGTVTTLDASPYTNPIAKKMFALSPHGYKVKLLEGLASDTLPTLNGKKYDFIFIDADKENYSLYFEHAVSLLNENGIIAIDNTLREGKVLDPITSTDKCVADLNMQIKNDPRVKCLMLPMRDGITLVKKCN